MKIPQHTKNQENLFEWKKKDNSANVEMTQIISTLALFEKDFIGAIIKLLQWTIMNMLELKKEKAAAKR